MFWIRIAVRALLRHRRRTLLTGFALAGGYFFLSLGLSITEGTYSNLIGIFTLDQTGHVQVHRAGYIDRPTIEDVVPRSSEALRAIRSVPGVRAASSRIKGPALAYGHQRTAPVSVVGIDPELEPRVTRVKDKLKAGEFVGALPGPDGVYGAMVGAGVLESLSVSLGDELVMISQGSDGSVANDVFVVTGVIGTEESRDANTVYLPLEAARRFYALSSDDLHEIAVRGVDHRSSKRLAREIQEELNSLFTAGASLHVAPWQEVEEDFNRAMEADLKGNNVTFLILVFIVGIGVLNTVLMSILERTREFGVMRAIGTRPSEVFRLVMIESAVLSAGASFVGAILSLPVNLWFERVGIRMKTVIDIGGVPYDRLLGEVSAPVFLLPASLTIGVALAISIWPAWRAASMAPVEAMRSN